MTTDRIGEASGSQGTPTSDEELEPIVYTQDWGDKEEEEEEEEQSETEESQETEEQPPKKEYRPPPIVVREEGKLDILKKEAAANKIDIVSFRSTGEGLKVFPKTATDFRRLKKLLDGKNIQCHTYCLRDEKPLKVVIRGVPKEVTNEEVEEELKGQGRPILSVSRMKKNKEALPMLMVNVEKTPEGRKVFDVTRVAGLSVKVEPKRKPTTAMQCYRCQMYGHIQFRCTAQYKCVRCAEPHPSFECPHKGKRSYQSARTAGPTIMGLADYVSSTQIK